MGRPLGLARVNHHGAPGHPMAWFIWFAAALFFLYEYILRVAPGIIEKDLEKQFHLDEGGMGACIVVDENHIYFGLVTDGDVRRALLRGAELHDPVYTITNQVSVTGMEGVDYETILAKMTDRVRH